MIRIRVFAGAVALACGVAFYGFTAHAAATDYRFELAGKPQLSAQKNIVQVRLVHTSDGEAVPHAVVFESTADMGPAGMASMTAPVKPVSAQGGVYGFEVDSVAGGTWALHLAAKVQGEPETVRGAVNVDLVK